MSDQQADKKAKEKSMMIEEAVGEVGSEIVVDSPEKWQSASTVAAKYTITRPDGTKLTFNLKGISAALYYEIVRQCTAMAVPKKLVRPTDVRGNIIKGAQPMEQDDPDDPTYQKNRREMSDKLTVLLVDAALPFAIPGKDWKDKLNWLQDRLPGDIDKMFRFIQDDLCNFGMRIGGFL